MNDPNGIRSAYPLTDQPIGTSVPFIPQARPWNIRSTTQRPLDEHEDDDAAGELHPAAQRPIFLPPTRKTASVTENQGFVQQARFIKQDADFRKAGNPLKGGVNFIRGSHVRDDIIVDLNDSRRGPQAPRDEDQMTKPALLWLLLGAFVFPPFLLCGFRYVRSFNVVARRLGYLSLFVLIAYILIGLVIFVQFYSAMYKSGWSGTDPICIQYLQGQGSNFLDNPLGSAFSIYGVSSVGIGPITNISVFGINCGFVMQVPVLLPSKNANFQTLYVRVNTPSTTGDDFGVYARNRLEGQVNRFMDPAPALSWFQFADPTISNPWTSASGRTDRPVCLQDMCSGTYGKATPLMTGIRYDTQVVLGKYQYQMLIGVFAIRSGALSRAFCVDTCAIAHVVDSTGRLPRLREADSDSPAGSWSNPCAGQDLLTCPQAQSCIFAKSRNDCLGIV